MAGTPEGERQEQRLLGEGAVKRDKFRKSTTGTESECTRDSNWEERQPGRNTTPFAWLEEKAWFQNTTLVVIMINALWIFIDVEWNHTRLADDDGKLPLEPGSTVVENLFCAYFFVEVVVRLLAFKRKRYMWKDAWFVFDSILVLFMVIETWIIPIVEALSGGGKGGGALSQFSSLRLLRLLRLTRMARIMKFFPELMTMVKGVARAVQAVSFVLFFMVLVMYVFAIIFTTQLGKPNGGEPEPGMEDEDPTAFMLFASMGSSMMTLFTNGVLMDNLAQALQAIKAESLILMWLFILHLAIAALTLLNMLIGVLCQVIDDTARQEAEANSVLELRSCLKEAFDKIDTSKDGLISAKEWSQIKNSDTVRDSLINLGVEECDLDERLKQMQDVLFGQPAKTPEGKMASIEDDSQSAGEGPVLSFEDFIDKVLLLRWDHAASSLEVEALKLNVQVASRNLTKELDKIETQLASMPLPIVDKKDIASPPITDGHPEFLKDVPTELILHVLKQRKSAEDQGMARPKLT